MLRIATFLALSTAVISGTANFLNKYAVGGFSNAVFFTFLKNSIAAALLVGVVLAWGKRKEIAHLSRRTKWLLLAVGGIGGSLPFGLFFTGLTLTSALNAALIHKTLVVWVALLAVPFLKERFSPLQWLGVMAVFSANFLIGGFQGFKLNAGEMMILAATILWGIENIIAKKALAEASGTVTAAARMVVGSVLLGAYLLIAGKISMASLTLSVTQWNWLLLTGAMLTGFTITWYNALQRAPATYVAALLLPATLVTNILSAVFVTHTFTGLDTVRTGLFCFGTVLVLAFGKKNVEAKENVVTFEYFTV